MALDKGFMDDSGDAIINLAFIGVLCIFGIQYILGKQMIINRNIVNLEFRLEITDIFINYGIRSQVVYTIICFCSRATT